MIRTATIAGAVMFLAVAAGVAVPVIGAAPGGAGGVAPAGRAGAVSATSANSAMNSGLKPKVFPPVPDDPMERPEFQTKAHPITKNVTTAKALVIREQRDGSMLGLATDVIATVPAATRRGGASQAVFVSKQAEVGEDMRTSFDEAVRAVKMRYPTWEPGRIEFSFGEKYTAHDGGSAGTCFATMLLSMLEGFDIDPKCAVTGDITVDWKVRKIGGVGAKLRGATADHCLYAGIPEDNAPMLADMALYYGDASLRDIQIFSMATLQDAVALLRKDRSPQMVEAMKEFTDLQPRLKAGGRAALASSDVQKALEQILVYAPNHESAKWLLEIGKGTAPKKLSPVYSLYQIMVALYPYRHILADDEEITRATVPVAMYQAARKQLDQLGPLTPAEIQPLMRDASAIISTAESIATKQSQPKVMKERAQSFVNHYEALGSNKELIEKMMREGY